MTSKLGLLAATLPAEAVATLAEFNHAVKNALTRIPRSKQSRELVIKYLLLMASKLSKVAGLSEEEFVSEARGCFQRDDEAAERSGAFQTAPKPRCLAS